MRCAYTSQNQIGRLTDDLFLEMVRTLGTDPSLSLYQEIDRGKKMLSRVHFLAPIFLPQLAAKLPPRSLFDLVDDEFTWIIDDQMEVFASHGPSGILDATNRSRSRYRLSEKLLGYVVDSYAPQFLLTFCSENYQELIERKVMWFRPAIKV